MAKVVESIRRGLEEAVAYAQGTADASRYRAHIPPTPTDAITMRELRKLSATVIATLPHAVPIRRCGKTVGWLTPCKTLPLATGRASPELLHRLAEIAGQELATRTPEQQAIYDEILREIGEA